MVRIFSGATRAEVQKTQWVPVTLASDLTLLGDHAAALIDAAAEYAVMEVAIPTQYTSRAEATLVLVGVANLTDMGLIVGIDAGSNGQNPADRGNGTVARNVTTVANEIVELDLSVPFDEAVVVGNDYVGIRIIYRALTNSDPATNVYVLGFKLRWY